MPISVPGDLGGVGKGRFSLVVGPYFGLGGLLFQLYIANVGGCGGVRLL